MRLCAWERTTSGLEGIGYSSKENEEKLHETGMDLSLAAGKSAGYVSRNDDYDPTTAGYLSIMRSSSGDERRSA